MGTRVDAASPSASGVVCPQTSKDGEFLPAQAYECVRKRALKKAINKAATSGHSLYRGKTLYANVSVFPKAPDVTCPVTGPRVKVFSWNCDGLTTTLYSELLCWLRKHSDISVIMLQETHWSRSMEWSSEDWHFCHSASLKANTAGVLIGVRATLARPDTISWKELLPGRLMQMRCYCNQQHMDLVCAYQHAMGFGDATKLQSIFSKRRSFWRELDALMHSLPYRSHVIVGGDMNCSVEPLSKLVGFGVLGGPNTDSAKADRQHFMQILKSHQLCILNSWGPKAATYRHPKGRSQIDFLACRRALADATAKACQPVETLLAGWRSSGHSALVASVRAFWQPWQLRRPIKDHVIQQAKQALCFGETAGLQQLHSALTPARSDRPLRPRLPQRETSDGYIVGFWQLRRRLSRLHWRDAQGIFTAWRLAMKLRSAKKRLDQHLRRTKRAQILTVLGDAEEAARGKLMGSFYKYVNLLCPKASMQRIRLRNQSGELLSTQAECQLLADYAKMLFTGQPWVLPPLRPVSSDMFSAPRWLQAFRDIPREKAVPIFTPSLSSWKDAAPHICEALAAIASDCFSAEQPVIPTEWASVQIAWLPKPNKSPSSPANLRTIGLMSGDHKALLHIIKSHIKDPIMLALRNTPQYAYRQGASTADAILRSTEHCVEVRHRLESLKTDLTTKLAGRHREELMGGLMANLDLAKAFDSLPYREIYFSLTEAGVDEPLCRLIIHLHASTRCAILHGSHCATVPMSRGLRQGCPIAPYIFAAWSVRVCRLLDGSLGTGWSASHLTLFSDDTHCFWSLRCLADLGMAVSQLTTLVQSLQELGMSINFTKSSAVCALKGRSALQAQRQHFRWRNGALTLRLPQTPTDLYIPLEDTLEYLGVTLSYHHFELQTAKLRADKAQGNFGRLHKVLRTNGPLSVVQRLRVYKACVLSSLMYGLIGVGLTASSYKVIVTSTCKHLRKLLRIYQEGVMNAQVLSHADIDLPRDLRQRSTALAKAICGDQGRSEDLKAPEIRRVRAVVDGIDSALESTGSSQLTRISQHNAAVVDCPVCGLYFSGVHNLVMHINSQHPSLNQRAKIPFLRHQHALHGIPRCRFCRSIQFSWQVLEQHVAGGMCPRIKDGIGRGQSIQEIFQAVLDRERVDPPIPPHGLASVSSALLYESFEVSQPLHLALQDMPVVRSFGEACALCGQRLQDVNRVKFHWRTTHPAAWNLVEREVKSQARSLSALFKSPCSYCRSQAKDPKAHSVQCPVLFQFLASRMLRARQYSADELQKQAGPSQRQSERRAAYLDFDPKQQPLAQAFRASAVAPVASSTSLPKPSSDVLATSRPSQPFQAAGPATAAVPGTTPAMFQRFPGAQRLHESGSETSTAPRHSTVIARVSANLPWSCTLRLANPHTQCYINACLLALGHAVTHTAGDQWPLNPDLGRVFKLCQEHSPGAAPLHIAGHPMLMALTPGWYFGIRQQDASEYLELLLRRDFLSVWSARVFEGSVRDCDGGVIISLTLPGQPTTVQDMIQAWHSQHYLHALCSEPDFLCIQLGRYPHQIKNSTKIEMPLTIDVPAFSASNTLEVHAVQYRLISSVIHLGRSPTAGHYRALLRAGSHWFYANDHVSASRVPLTDEHKRGSYILMFLKA